MKNSCFSKSYSFHPLFPNGYPTNTHFLLRALNLSLSRCMLCAKHRHPNVFMSVYTGALPYKISYGVFPFSKLEGVLLMTCAAASTLSPQNLTGRLARNMIDLATLSMWRCFLSTLPFCRGVATQEVWCKIPFSANYLERHVNSVPLSLLTVLTCLPNCLCANRQKFGSTVFTSDFSRRRCIQTALE